MAKPILKAEFQMRQLAKTAVILWDVFSLLPDKVKSGSNGLHIQEFMVSQFERAGAKPVLMGYRNFRADISVSVNEIAAHGIPDDRAFKSGDLITIDAAIVKDGWYGDMAWTFGIPPLNIAERRLIKAAWQSCVAGCKSVLPGTPLGTLGSKVIQAANGLGARVVNQLCGHGIGQSLHEAPLIPYTSQPGHGWLVESGMVLNIEPVLTLGRPNIQLHSDGISYSTTDGKPTAQFELCCACDRSGVRFLSLPDFNSSNIPEYPPL